MADYELRKKVEIMMKNIGGLTILWGYPYTRMLETVNKRLNKNKGVQLRDRGAIDTLWAKYVELNQQAKEKNK